MAFADGILIDAMLGNLGDVSRQHFPGVQVAMTDSVDLLVRRAVSAGADFAGCWHDILWMAQCSPSQLLGNGRTFRVGLRHSDSLRWVELKIVFHKGDHDEPCATVMLPHED
jgi:hypothetical protein